MEKRYPLKLFLKWRKREIKENGGETEFNYDIL
jgi:hypothetical protein